MNIPFVNMSYIRRRLDSLKVAVIECCSTNRFIYGVMVFCSALYPLSFSLHPLYEQDQLIYFLRGLAWSGVGFLSDDFLVAFKPMYILFDCLVYVTQIFFHPFFFYVYAWLFQSLFIYMLVVIAIKIVQPKRSFVFILFLFGGLYFLSSAYLWELLDWTSVFHPRIWLRGVANQFINTTHIIPSSFGVFFLVSMYFFLLKRPYWAVVFSVLALSFHSAMFVTAFSLILSYCVWLWKEESFKKACYLGGFSILLSLPISIYTIWFCWPESMDSVLKLGELYKAASPLTQDILVWFDSHVFIKVGIVFFAGYLARRSRLFLSYVIVFSFGFLLTFLCYVVDISLLNMLIPWRMMAVLVPLSFSIILTRSIDFFLKDMGKMLFFYMILLLAVSVSIGYGIQSMTTRFHPIISEHTMDDIIAYIYTHKKKGDVYMIPVTEKKVRLRIEAPVFVDVKSMPGEGGGFIEWHRRFQWVSAFYESPDKAYNQGLFLRYPQITHVILPKGHRYEKTLSCLYKNDNFGIYSTKGLSEG